MSLKTEVLRASFCAHAIQIPPSLFSSRYVGGLLRPCTCSLPSSFLTGQPEYMQRLMLLASLLFGTLLSTQAQIINTEALDTYRSMTAKLKQGDSLSVDTWNNFLQLKGNQIYIKNQAFDQKYLSSLRKAIEIVYSPAYANVLAERMKKPFDYWLTYKVNQYKVHEAELKTYQQQLTTAAYQEAIYTNAWA